MDKAKEYISRTRTIWNRLKDTKYWKKDPRDEYEKIRIKDKDERVRIKG